MEILLIVASWVLAATKVLSQGRFAKNMAKTPSDALFFNGLIFSTGAVMLLPIFGINVPLSGIFAGFLVGAFNVIFQMAYVCAFSCGPISLTAMISTTSMVVPIIFSAIAYDEPLSVFRIIGIIVTIIALYFTTEKIKKDSIKLKWALFTLLAFVANFSSSLVQKIYLKSVPETDTSSFVAVHFAFAAIISLGLYFILSASGKKCSYKIGKNVIFTSLFIGVILGIFNLIYSYSLLVVDATVYLPIFNGGLTVLVTLCGSLFMKEKLTKRQKISIILGVIAIVLMSL